MIFTQLTRANTFSCSDPPAVAAFCIFSHRVSSLSLLPPSCFSPERENPSVSLKENEGEPELANLGVPRTKGLVLPHTLHSEVSRAFANVHRGQVQLPGCAGGREPTGWKHTEHALAEGMLLYVHHAHSHSRTCGFPGDAGGVGVPNDPLPGFLTFPSSSLFLAFPSLFPSSFTLPRLAGFFGARTSLSLSSEIDGGFSSRGTELSRDLWEGEEGVLRLSEPSEESTRAALTRAAEYGDAPHIAHCVKKESFM